MLAPTFFNIPSEVVQTAEGITAALVRELISVGSSVDEHLALAEFDLEGNVVKANAHFLQLYGFTREEIIGQHHRVTCPPELLASGEYANYWEQLHAGQAVSGEFARITSSGQRIHIYGLAAPVIGASGTPERFLKFAHDTSVSRQAAIDADTIKNSVRQFQVAAEFDLQGRLTEANACFLSAFQYPNDSVVGMLHSELCDPAYASGSEYAEFWAGLLAGQVHNSLFQRRDSQGGVVWLRGSYAPVKGIGDIVDGVMLIASDVTEIKRKALEDDAKLDAISHTQAVIEFDMRGVVLSANDIFCAAMGYKAAELVGQTHSALCAEKYAESAEYVQFWSDLRAGMARSGEFKRQGKRGKVVWLQATYTPILGFDGKPYKVVKFATDITSSKLRALEDGGKVAAILRSQGVIEFDMAGNVLDANANFLSLLGYTLDEIKGQHHRQFVDDANFNPAAYRAFWQKLGDGQFESGEFMRVGKGGKRVWLQATYNPILDLDGLPVKVVKFCTDITAQKAATIENEARQQIAYARACVVDLDADGAILQANEKFCHALDLPLDGLLGRHEVSLWFDDEASVTQRRACWASLQAGTSFSAEMRLKGGTGREIWFSLTWSPVPGLDGKLHKVFLMGNNITEQKQAQLEADAKLGAMDRSQASIEFELSGKVLKANQNFLKLMGYASEEVVGRQHRIFVEPAAAASAEYQMFWDALGRGEYVASEFKRLGKDGREVWIQASYNPVFDAMGKVAKVVKFATDVTASKLRNAEFEAKVAAIDKGQAVIEFDLNGNVITANRNFLAAMGYTLREIQGQHHSLFCSPEYTQSIEYRDFWLRLGEGQFVSGRFHRVGKYQRDVWLQSTYNPILDLNGQVMKVVKYAFDVTKEIRLEQSIASRADDMNISITGLVKSIEHIADNSGVASEMAAHAAAAAESGNEALNKSIAAIRRIEASSAQVTEIVRVISDIANQTHLLAFNAAIEAARAEQHGVGFSVVASEVRKLAERSAAAAKEIAILIDGSNRQIKEGAEVSLAAASSFEGITSRVKSTVMNVQEIAKFAHEQRTLASQVAELISGLTGSVSHV